MQVTTACKQQTCNEERILSASSNDALSAMFMGSLVGLLGLLTVMAIATSLPMAVELLDGMVVGFPAAIEGVWCLAGEGRS